MAEHVGGGKKRRNPRGGELVINTLSLPAARPHPLAFFFFFFSSLGLPRVHISGDAREGEGREGPSKIKNKGRKAAAAAYALMKFLTITLAATGEKVGIIGNGAKTMMNGLGIDERNINSNASPHCGCEEKEKEETFPSAEYLDKRNLDHLPATQSFSSLPLLSSRVFNRTRSQIRLGSFDRSEFANFVSRLHFDDCSTMTSDISIGRSERKKRRKEGTGGNFKSREKGSRKDFNPLRT